MGEQILIRYTVAVIGFLLVIAAGPIIRLMGQKSNPAGPLPTITAVILNGDAAGSYTSGASSGTDIGPIVVTMSSGTFDGSFAPSTGTPGSYFSINSSNLVTNGTTPTCTSSTPYNFNIIATPRSGESGSAYTLPVTVTCNPSGGGPTPPAGAQAAEFMTLVLNLDFTGATTSSFMGHTIDPTNICGSTSSWLSSPEQSTNPTTPVFWNTSAVPCIRISVNNDGGIQILDMQFAQNDGATYGANATSIQGATKGEQSNWLLPIGAWYEIEYRQTTAATNSCPFTDGYACLQSDWWTWYSSGDTELDFIEILGNAYGSCHFSSSPDCDTYADWSDPASNIISSYHTYASRITTDGTNASVCGFLDGTLNNCNRIHGPWAIASSTLHSRRYPIMTVGPETGSGPCAVGTYGPDNGNCAIPTANIDAYIRHITVWSCSTWQTTPCTSAVLMN